jgi:hypothetical protein
MSRSSLWLRRALPAALIAAVIGLAPLAMATPGGPPPVPIPEGPQPAAANYLGHPRPARPITGASFAPRHPYMAGNDRSNLHDDAYQSDAGRAPGPLGYSPRVASTLFTQECASVTFDRAGRLLTVCVGLATVDLRLLDPKTLSVLADLPLGPRPTSSAQHPFTAFGGGGYFYLDNHDRVVVPTSDGHIDVIREAGPRNATQLVLQRQYDVSSQVGRSVILAVMPDWSGRLWFVTASGVVGAVDPRTGATHAMQLPHSETIGNSIAVDETGGVFVVSDRALYRFDGVRHGRPAISWRRPYDAGTRQKPGQSEFGSGTTPTIVRRGSHHYVAITDNADPRMHVVVWPADRHAGHAKPVCRMPVFAPRRGDTDNSLIAVGNAIIVENNYGYTGPEQSPSPDSLNRGTPTTQPGVARIDVNYRRGGCHVAWTNDTVRVPTSVSKVSAATGLVYVYEHPAAGQIHYTSAHNGDEDPWYLTALDERTGRRVWSVRTGDGLGFNNNYAPITLGPDGTAYIGVLGGLVSVRDSRPGR